MAMNTGVERVMQEKNYFLSSIKVSIKKFVTSSSVFQLHIIRSSKSSYYLIQ